MTKMTNERCEDDYEESSYDEIEDGEIEGYHPGNTQGVRWYV